MFVNMKGRIHIYKIIESDSKQILDYIRRCVIYHTVVYHFVVC